MLNYTWGRKKKKAQREDITSPLQVTPKNAIRQTVYSKFLRH